MRVAAEPSDIMLLQTSSEILLPETSSSAHCICRARAEKNISFSTNFLLLIWFHATALNSVVLLFAALFY